MRRLAALLVLAVACSGAAGASATAAQVDLFEFGIDSDVASFRPGAVVLTVTNEGEFTHTLVVTADDGTVIAGTELIPPGATVETEVTLPTGDYELTCRIVAEKDDGTIVDHFARGMRKEVVVAGPAAETDPSVPTPSLTTTTDEPATTTAPGGIDY